MTDSSVILETKNLHKHFGGLRALDGCGLKIQKGTITAIIGPNGSGKSTLFNVVSNLLKKKSGSISFNNTVVDKKKDYERARLGMSRTFQEVRLFRNLTIRDHMEIALSESDEGLFKSFFKTEKQKDLLPRIQEILELVNLDKPLSTYATDLSYGQRKLLDLAIAIAKPHSLLMLDEPVAGINPKLRNQIKKIIRKLNKMGETILLIEHDMNFTMDLADYIWVMDYGKVIAHGKPKQIQNNKKVLDAYLGD